MRLSKPVPETKPFEIRRSTIQGRGAFATRRIPKGMRIAEYTGERISAAEGERRYDDESMARHHTFLFSINRTLIDAAVGGNDSRFINHSCEPNCDAVIEGGRIFIEALANIPAGAELFYDYMYECEPDFTVDDLALYPCYCGTPSCRGTILTSPPRARKRKRRKARRTRRRD
jgi:SET domain-containing protein